MYNIQNYTLILFNNSENNSLYKLQTISKEEVIKNKLSILFGGN